MNCLSRATKRAAEKSRRRRRRKTFAFAVVVDRLQRVSHLQIIVDSKNYKGGKKVSKGENFFAQIIIHFTTQKRPLLTTKYSQLLCFSSPLVIFKEKQDEGFPRAPTRRRSRESRRALVCVLEKLHICCARPSLMLGHDLLMLSKRPESLCSPIEGLSLSSPVELCVISMFHGIK